MKKQYVTLLAVLLSTSVYLFSCGDKMAKKRGNLTFDSICINETAHLFSDTAKPACNLVITFTYPVKSSDAMLQDSLTAALLSACLEDQFIGLTPADAVKEFVQSYVSNYRNNIEPMYTEDKNKQPDESDNSTWYSYYKTIKSSVQFYEKSLLVYRIYCDEFTGGAHGMYTETFLNIDLNTMRPLHLNDLFVEEYREALTELIWRQLMHANNVTTRAELEELGYGSTGEIAPTENFFLQKEGITFYYNVYDITPYSMGPVQVHIPFDMMTNLLSSNPLIEELRSH